MKMTADGLSPETWQAGGLPSWKLRRVKAYIEANLCDRIEVDRLAEIAQLSSGQFARSFRRSVGRPPHAYLTDRRMARAKWLMLNSNDTLTSIAHGCGMADQAHLSRVFRRVVGDSPAAWRRARGGGRSSVGRPKLKSSVPRASALGGVEGQSPHLACWKEP